MNVSDNVNPLLQFIPFCLIGKLLHTHIYNTQSNPLKINLVDISTFIHVSNDFLQFFFGGRIYGKRDFWISFVMSQGCLENRGEFVGNACGHHGPYVPDVLFWSVILFFSTVAMSSFLKEFKTSRYFPTKARSLCDFAKFTCALTYSMVKCLRWWTYTAQSVNEEFTLKGDGVFLVPDINQISVCYFSRWDLWSAISQFFSPSWPWFWSTTVLESPPLNYRFPMSLKWVREY